MSTAADYEALDRLEAETANIAAAGRWLLAADRIAELMQFFNDVPFFDVYSAPVTTVQELGGIAGEAVERTDAAASPGFLERVLDRIRLGILRWQRRHVRSLDRSRHGSRRRRPSRDDIHDGVDCRRQ